MLSRIHRILECNGQTDGQTDRIAILILCDNDVMINCVRTVLLVFLILCVCCLIREDVDGL